VSKTIIEKHIIRTASCAQSASDSIPMNLMIIKRGLGAEQRAKGSSDDKGYGCVFLHFMGFRSDTKGEACSYNY
jgi:hypothetical protein